MTAFRTVLFTLVIGGTAAGLTGCVPEGKSPPADPPVKDQSVAPNEPAKGPPAPEGSSPLPVPVGPAVPIPTDDPRHVALRSYRAAVGGREEEIAAALLRLDAAVGKIAVAAPADQKAALEEFRKLVPVLREASRALLADHRAVTDATETLVKDLRHGPTAYRQAARAWRERAEDYQTEAFRKNALGYAEEFERYADRLPERRKEIVDFAEELREQLPFLRELGSSVEDFARFLEQHPGAGLPDPRPQYVAQLRGYAAPLTVFQGLIRKYLDAIRAGSVSPGLQTGYRTEKAKSVDKTPSPEPDPQPKLGPRSIIPVTGPAAELPPPTVELIRTPPAPEPVAYVYPQPPAPVPVRVVCYPAVPPNPRGYPQPGYVVYGPVVYAR